jgi:hypothetical protein
MNRIFDRDPEQLDDPIYWGDDEDQEDDETCDDDE